jgi:hypothetical protein
MASNTPIVRALDANHDYTFGRNAADYLTLTASTEQRVRCFLLLILGEFFLNTGRGIPWFQTEAGGAQPIMGGPKDLAYTESVLKAGILQIVGVATIVSFSMKFTPATRKLTVSVTVTDDDDQPIVIKDLGP